MGVRWATLQSEMERNRRRPGGAQFAQRPLSAPMLCSLHAGPHKLSRPAHALSPAPVSHPRIGARTYSLGQLSLAESLPSLRTVRAGPPIPAKQASILTFWQAATRSGLEGDQVRQRQSRVKAFSRTPLQNNAPDWWRKRDDETVVAAAEAFDRVSHRNFVRGQQLQSAVFQDCTSRRKAEALRKETTSLFRNRYVAPEILWNVDMAPVSTLGDASKRSIRTVVDKAILDDDSDSEDWGENETDEWESSEWEEWDRSGYDAGTWIANGNDSSMGSEYDAQWHSGGQGDGRGGDGSGNGGGGQGGGGKGEVSDGFGGKGGGDGGGSEGGGDGGNGNGNGNGNGGEGGISGMGGGGKGNLFPGKGSGGKGSDGKGSGGKGSSGKGSDGRRGGGKGQGHSGLGDGHGKGRFGDKGSNRDGNGGARGNAGGRGGPTTGTGTGAGAANGHAGGSGRGRKDRGQGSSGSKRLDLGETIWAPRASWADAKDYYDSADIKWQRFDLDWRLAQDMLGLVKVILKADKGEGGLDDRTEVDEVGAVLWESHDMIYQLFAYYAAGVGGDIDGLGLNEWTLFVDDHKLASKHFKLCKKADCDRLFIAVDGQSTRYWTIVQKHFAQKRSGGSSKKPGDAEDPIVSGTAKGDKKKALTRAEFIGALVHIAIYRYVATGEIKDVSEALHVLLTHEVEPRVTHSEIADPNQFRQAHCYTSKVCKVLVKHESSLRIIFSAIAGGGRTGGASAGLMKLVEYMDFLHVLGFAGIDLSDRDARLAFVWSRMAVVDPHTEKGHLRDTSLPFEGFLEAICRISVCKSLPTDDEIAQAGFAHAGSYMANLRLTDEEAYQRMLVERAQPWGAEPTLQPVARCVDHTISMMICSIESDTAGADDLGITAREMTNYMKDKGLIKAVKS